MTKEMNERLKINVGEELRQELMKRFECDRTTVWRALNYLTDTFVSRSIRQAAIDGGGEIISMKTLTPEEAIALEVENKDND